MIKTALKELKGLRTMTAREWIEAAALAVAMAAIPTGLLMAAMILPGVITA